MALHSNRGGHRSHQSLSLPPSGGLTRGANNSAMSSQTSLTLPEGSRASPRPPSPLRNAFTFDSSTGVDPANASFGSDDEQHPGWRRSPSPTSSVSNLAASFVQRVNNFVGGITAPPSPLPSDAELEAEAERERERSRREAEAILVREAQQRRQVEDRVLAMMDSTRGLPPPPSRSQTMPPTTPSPSTSQKESASWWQAAKHKLTPTKEKDPPTPAQQIIMDAKARDKKGKGREEDPQGNVFQEESPLQPPQRKPAPASPSSPTPSRPNLSTPNLSPGPIRMSDSLANSPSRDPPPMYAQFNAQGTLDVPATLLAIARRFEKLEKWTIGHVRALEDRMNDVERWLVDKEKEKETDTKSEKPAGLSVISETPALKEEMSEIREEISELQGRVGELGREMAKMATSPSNLSAGPKPQTASLTMLPRQPSTQLFHETTEAPPVLPPITPDLTGTPRHSRLSSTALDTTSPPLASRRTGSGTKLPYPTGDYNSPLDAFSPPNSPPSSLNASHRKRSSISGLPSVSSGSPLGSTIIPPATFNRPMSPPSSSPLPSSLTRSPKIPSGRTESPTPAGNGLPPPKPKANFRQSSVSPTPRKRYTVPLGGPIVAPPSPEDTTADPEPLKRVSTPKPFSRNVDTDDDDEDDGGETIGKSASARLQRSLATKRSTTSLSSVNSNTSDKDTGGLSRGRGDYKASAPSNPIPVPSSSAKKFRAQSAYGFSEMQAQNDKYRAERAGDIVSGSSSGTTQPLRLKTRTRSTEQLVPDGPKSAGVTTATGGTFVDPLLRRRQETKSIAMPKPVGKAGIGQLVAFFDKDKKDKA